MTKKLVSLPSGRTPGLGRVRYSLMEAPRAASQRQLKECLSVPILMSWIISKSEPSHP